MANSIPPIATCTDIFHFRLEMSRCKPRILHDRYQVPFIANSRIPFDALVKPLMRNNLSIHIINHIIAHYVTYYDSHCKLLVLHRNEHHYISKYFMIS